MMSSNVLGTLVVSAVLAFGAACGPSEQARTVTSTDTSTSNANGSKVQTHSTETDVSGSDGSKSTTKTEQVNQQPAK